MNTKTNGGISRAALIIIVCASLAHFCLMARHVALTAVFPYPVSYDESVAAMWAKRSLEGETLYPQVKENPPYLHNPYTPLYARVTGMVMEKSDNIFLSGRLLSLMSALACAALIFRIAGQCSNHGIGLAAGALFLFSPIASRYAFMVRPDMLGLVYSLAGVCLISVSGTIPSAIMAGVLSASALLTKQSFLAGPLAIILWSVLSKKRICAIYLITLIVCFFGGMILFAEEGLSEIVKHLIAMNLLSFDFSNFFAVISGAFNSHIFLLIVAVIFVVIGRKEKNPLWYYMITSFLMAISSGKTGAEENHLLETIALMCMSFGYVAGQNEIKRDGFMSWLLTAQLLLFFPVPAQSVFTRTYGQEIVGRTDSITPTEGDREASSLLIAEILSVPDPILCEDPGYLVVADKKVVLQPYQFAQLGRMGKWDDSLIVEMVKSREFGMIVLKSNPASGKSVFFSDEILRAVSEYYTLRRHIGQFYVFDPGV